jgi:hypothetical protein
MTYPSDYELAERAERDAAMRERHIDRTDAERDRRKDELYASMDLNRLGYLAGMMCMTEARIEHARRMQMESEHKVVSVTWNDDGTMTVVIEGHVEPVRSGDVVVYRKANYSETPNS